MNNACSPSRLAAFEMLLDYTKNGIWSDRILENSIHLDELDKRDRALAINVFTGTVQNIRLLDFYISRLSKREINCIDVNALIILRSALYQIIFLDRVPERAAVNEAVILCDKYSKGAKTFVNAILRRAASEELSINPEEFKEYASYLSVKYSCADWFSAYLVNRFGSDTAENFLSLSVKAPDITIQINTCQISAENYKELLEKSGIFFRASDLIEGSYSVSGVRVSELPGYSDGLFYIQDDSSRLCSAVAACKPYENILDCCASPGGKSYAAAIASHDKAVITSCDISEKKIEAVKQGAERLKLKSINCFVKDAKVTEEDFVSNFDCVICDAPCSGMGVIRKKPEIKYKNSEEISRLPGIQRDILKNVSKYVKPGGRLIYSTCTVLREENEDVVESLVREGNFELCDFNLKGIVSENGMYTFLPGKTNTDGFFVANLKRIH